MNWTILATLVGIGGAFIGAFNGWFILQMRAQISDLKLEMLTSRLAEQKELRLWIDDEYARKDMTAAQMHNLSAHLARLENMGRRTSDREREAQPKL